MQESGINKRILTWGEAGVGKTTFCSKLTQDWAEIVKGRENPESTKLTEEQRHLLSNIGLVLYIVFRDTEENQSLNDIVQSQIFKAIGAENKCINVSEQKYHRDILLVCDGLDEVSYAECELLEIIAGRMYPNIRCIVTCRPHASLGMSLTAHAEIRLKGFSKEQAQHFVNAYFESKFPNDKAKANQYSVRLWDQIETSIDLTEMAQNPSMLQLLCKLFLANGKIAKDKASVFQDYTIYLLHHYHIKQHKGKITKTELTALYKNTLQKAGKLALQGLQQSHLQLIFNKENVIESAGIEMFDIGFVSEIPGHGSEHPKAQFVHKTQQEYLAAYFIVNSSEHEGLKYLMEFCSTSNGLMGSQIILTFITSMSKKMGKVIQKQISELVSSWTSEDDIKPKDRTGFLLTMLKENPSLVFPLPKEIDINVKEYELSIRWFHKLFQLFSQKNPLVKFFGFDSQGVQHLSIALGQKYRLQLAHGFKSLIELYINFQGNVSADDPIHLKELVEGNKKLRIISMARLNTRMMLDILQNRAFLSSLDKAKQLNMIKIYVSELNIDVKTVDAFRHIPSNLEIVIHGNRLEDQSGCKALIERAAHQKALVMQDCGLMIDTEIAEAISQLPEQANLDLSGNTITKMDSSLLCHVIPVISNKKIDLSGLGLVIDDKVAEALCSLNKHLEVDLSRNRFTDKSVCITLVHKAATFKSLSVCKIGKQIDTEIADAVSGVPGHTQLDLSGNQVTGKSACITLIHKAATMKSLSICNCGIEIDTEIAEAVSVLPDHTQLDLSGNQVTDKSVRFTLIHKAANMKSLTLCNCGIQIDTEIAEAVSRLPDHTELDLSGNDITKMEPYLLSRILNYMTNQKEMNIDGWGITVDEDIVKAMSKLTQLQTLIINHDHNNNKLTSEALSELPKTIGLMPDLQVFGLDNCDISNADMVKSLTEAFSKHCPLLEELSLSNNNMSSGVNILAGKLKQMKKMKRLYLNDCSIGVLDVGVLTDSLYKHCPLIEVLSLSCNKIKIGFYTVGVHIEYMKNMKSLYLDDCGGSYDAVVNLADNLSKHCPLLDTLSLSKNNLSSGNGKMAKHFHQMKNLKSLYLDECGISNGEVVTLTASLCKHCLLLEELSLFNNHLSSGVWDVLEHIQQMKNLRRLWLDENPCVKNDIQRRKIKTTAHRSNPNLDLHLN